MKKSVEDIAVDRPRLMRDCIALACIEYAKEVLNEAADDVDGLGLADKNDNLVNDDLRFCAGYETAIRDAENLIRSMKIGPPPRGASRG